MDIDILEIVKSVNNKHLAFDKYPAKDLELEQKIHYLNGLALLMNVDAEIHEKEKDYLATLIYSFELPKEKLNEFITFAKDPDEEVVLEMMQSFQSNTIKYVFLMDCYMLAYKDEVLKEKEKDLIYEYARMFKITKVDIERIYSLFKKISSRNRQGLDKIKLQSGQIDVSIFNYLFDYFNMNPAFKVSRGKAKRVKKDNKDKN